MSNQPPPPFTYGQQPPVGAFPAQQPPVGAFPAQQQAPGAYSNFPQAQPGYGQPTNSTVIVTSAPALPFFGLRHHPTPMQCTSCNSQIITTVHYETGTTTWVACLIIALLGFWLGCCLLPFCTNGSKDAVHTCPNCRFVLGTHKKM